MGLELRFSDKEITAWGGMGIMSCSQLSLDSTQAPQSPLAEHNGKLRGDDSRPPDRAKAHKSSCVHRANRAPNETGYRGSPAGPLAPSGSPHPARSSRHSPAKTTSPSALRSALSGQSNKERRAGIARFRQATRHGRRHRASPYRISVPASSRRQLSAPAYGRYKATRCRRH